MTTAQQYSAARKDEYSKLIAQLGGMSATQIQSKLNSIRSFAASLPSWKKGVANKMRTMANDAENHFFLILNPQMAFGENLSHAIKRGLPTP